MFIFDAIFHLKGKKKKNIKYCLNWWKYSPSLIRKKIHDMSSGTGKNNLSSGTGTLIVKRLESQIS